MGTPPDGRAERRPGATRPRASSLVRRALPLLRSAAVAGLALLPAACGTTLPPLPAVPEGMRRSTLPPPPPGGYPLEVSYTLLPGDAISITVREDDKLDFPNLVIPSTGSIEIWKTEAGDGKDRESITVLGRNTEQVAGAIADIYQRTRFQARPYVQVTLVDAVPRVVYVQGEVKGAGELPLPRTGTRLTLLRAIEAKGGVTDEADLSRVTIKRKDPATGAEISLPAFDLEEMKENSLFDRDPPLEPNDVINVPKCGKVWVYGHVNSPGPYPCKRGLTVCRLIAEAGDLKQFAKKSSIHVTRGEATVDQRTYSVDVGAIQDDNAPDPLLMPGDRVWIDEDWK